MSAMTASNVPPLRGVDGHGIRRQHLEARAADTDMVRPDRHAQIVELRTYLEEAFAVEAGGQVARELGAREHPIDSDSTEDEGDRHVPQGMRIAGDHRRRQHLVVGEHDVLQHADAALHESEAHSIF